MKTLTVGRRKVSKEELKALRVEGWQFQKAALAGEGFDRAIDVHILPLILGPQQRLHAARSDTMAQDGEQATTALVLGPQAHPLVAPLACGVALG